MNASEVYINGEKVGTSGRFPPMFRSGWSNFQSYAVREGVLRPGRNTVAVRVYYDAEAWVLGPLRILDRTQAESEAMLYSFFLVNALQGFAFLLIFVALFFGIFYFQRSKETEYLYFSFASFSVALSISLSYLENLYPALPLSSQSIFVMTQSGLLSFPAFLSLFVHQYSRRTISLPRKALTFSFPALAVIALVLAEDRTEALERRNLFLLAVSVFIVDILVHAFILIREKDRRGLMIMAAILPTVILGIHDALAFSLDFFEMKVALFVYAFPLLLIIIAAHLTNRFVSSLTEAEKLNVVLKETMDSFARFVPVEFLNHLKKSRITDVQVGDAIKGNMTVIFCDIRNFTAMSEAMSPDDNFRFLNSYLERMEPSIKKHHGFVDKFIGDAIMALFADSAEEAVLAAIDMRHALRTYNDMQIRQSKQPVEFGIGVNSGEVILGTVGTTSRMDTTVIGETVNLASRIESLTKKYGAAILISSHVYDRLPRPEVFHIREIDLVQVRGSRKPIKVYEVFDADEPDLFEKKKRVVESFAAALSQYRVGNFQEAAARFEQCLTILPDDTPSQLYLDRCRKYA
jgi:adenylate cyclase